MLSLHDTTEDIKKFALWGAIAAGGIIILIILFRIGGALIGIFNPPKVLPPTVALGTLPALSFPQSVTSEKLTYVNNTLSGELPAMPDRLLVYKIHQDTGNLLNLDQAKSGVSAIGFTPDPVSSDAAQIQLSNTQYQWTSTTDLPKKITMDIISKNFVFQSDFMTYPPTLSASFLPNENDAVQTALGFLTQVGAPTSDLDLNKTKTSLLTIQNGTLAEADTIENAQVIEINFFQKNIGTFPIVYQNPQETPLNALVASGEFTGQVVQANYFHQTYDDNADSTYPLITPQEAWTSLTNGQAYIASFNGTTNQILINNIYLAYYMTDGPEPYLEPVVVFAGKNNFEAYVPAIDYNKMNALLNPPPRK